MKHGHLWNTITTKLAAECLQKYGHILKWQNSSSHIIDIGCGEGTVTSKILYPYVKDRIRQLTAIDISQNIIDYAKKENKLDNIIYEVMDARSIEGIEKKKGMFDHVFSFYAAHWIQDQRSFANGLSKMLKPGGQIFVAHIAHCLVRESYRKLIKEDIWSKYLQKDAGMLYYTEDPAGYIRRIMEEAGFTVQVCEHEYKKAVVEHCADLVRSLTSLHQDIGKMPCALQKKYYQDSVKYCLGKCTYLREPEVYDWPFQTLTCIASK